MGPHEASPGPETAPDPRRHGDRRHAARRPRPRPAPRPARRTSAAPAAEAVVVRHATPPPPRSPTAPASAGGRTCRTAHAEAARTGKPLLLLFGAEWCVYCHKQTDETLADPAVAARVNADFVPVRLDFDADAKLAEVLEIKTLPQAVLLSPKADLLGRAAGFHNVEQFGGVLTGATGAFRRLNAARVAAAPSGAATL